MWMCLLVALEAKVKVSDRPMTQQGLGGMKTAAGGRGEFKCLNDQACHIEESKLDRCGKHINIFISILFFILKIQ